MKIKVYILANDINLLSTLNAKFSVAGFESSINHENNHLTVLRNLIKTKPDFLVVGFTKDNYEFYKLLQLVKEDDNLSSLPIIVYSQMNSQLLKEILNNLGINYFYSQEKTTTDELVEKTQKIINNLSRLKDYER
jgi:hypothetical protein